MVVFPPKGAPFPAVLVRNVGGVAEAIDGKTGALISSSTNHAQVLNNALDYAPAKGIVLVEGGVEYNFSTTVTVSDKMLRGLGKPIIKASGITAFLVQGGGILENFKISESDVGVKVSGSTIYVRNIDVEYPTSYGLEIDGDAGGENYYEHVYVQSAGEYAVYFHRADTPDVGGHYFNNLLIGNVSTTQTSSAGMYFYSSTTSVSHSFIRLHNCVVDGIKSGPAIKTKMIDHIHINGYWYTTSYAGGNILEFVDTNNISIVEAILYGPSDATGIYFDGSIDRVLINNVWCHGLTSGAFMNKSDTASVYNVQVGEVHLIDVDSVGNLTVEKFINNVLTSTEAGSLAGYYLVRINGTLY
ncbi:MAG: hypothetical protein DRO23_10105, partial [Thermoprotei archaeon]